MRIHNGKQWYRQNGSDSVGSKLEKKSVKIKAALWNIQTSNSQELIQDFSN